MEIQYEGMKRLDIKKLGDVYILLPHDDDIMSCAGIACSAHEIGNPTSVIVFTKGDLGYARSEDKENIVSIRQNEAKKAYGLLGVDYALFMGLPDMELNNYTRKASLRTIRELRQKRYKNRPEKRKTAFIPRLEDHVDHEAANRICRHVLSTQVGFSHVPDLGEPVNFEEIYEFGVWGNLEVPTHYFELPEKTYNMKRKAMYEFESQMDFIKKLEKKMDWKVEIFKKLP
jgi:LmbE family N-acetylglucosaminyl deacetylase